MIVVQKVACLLPPYNILMLIKTRSILLHGERMFEKSNYLHSLCSEISTFRQSEISGSHGGCEYDCFGRFD